VSNVGLFAQPRIFDGVEVAWHSGRATLSRCAYAAGGPLVVCVITTHESVGFGFTWQEGAIADNMVHRVIGGLKDFLEGPR